MKKIYSCPDGYPSCRKAEATGEFCANKCEVKAKITDTKTKEIKPCPWCESKDFTNLIVALNYRQRSCNKCSARGPVVKIKIKIDDFIDNTELDSFWNDRPSEKNLETEVAELKAQNEWIVNEFERVADFCKSMCPDTTYEFIAGFPVNTKQE